MTRHWEQGYKGPLPGNQMEFITPFLKPKLPDGVVATSAESRVICYCNEAVGTKLGFSLAPPRIGQFQQAPGATDAPLNLGKHFSKRANKGAFQYTLKLRPGTTITASYHNRETFALETKDFPKKTISISMDSSVSVTEMKLWLLEALGPGTELVKAVYALVTPSLVEHPIRSRAENGASVPLTTEQRALATELGMAIIVPGGGGQG